MKGSSNAFFMETFGSLNIRQACSVESLARLNPNMTVHLLIISLAHKIDGRNKKSANQQDRDPLLAATLTNLLREKYSNIHPVLVNGEMLDSFIARSPLSKWYFCSNWRKSPYAVEHLSDGLRLLMLSTFGGYYFDLDIVFVKPVEEETFRNFVVAQNFESLANGILHFDQDHPFVHTALRRFHEEYRNDDWGHNGPKLLNRILEDMKWCSKNESLLDILTVLTNSVETAFNCHLNGDKAGRKHHQRKDELKILHPKTFFPIFYPDWKTYFRDSLDQGTDDWDHRLIGAHVWNSFSSKYPVVKHSDYMYAQLSRSFCPEIYSIAPNTF